MIRVEWIARWVLLASLCVLAVLPFLHGYMHMRGEQTDRDLRAQVKVEEAANALASLKHTNTLWDRFVEERKRRLEARAKERQLADQARKSREDSISPIIPETVSRKIEDEILTPFEDAFLDSSDLDSFELKEGPLQKYVKDHDGAIPIVVMCHNRPEELGRTLDGMLALPTIKKDMIFVAQDGSLDSIRSEVNRRELKLFQNLQLEARQIEGGGKRIAAHYKIALDQAFAYFKDAPAIIIMEDDLSVSPDFLQWFVAAGAIVENDPTLWCVSAWNDNGFKGLVRGEYSVKRTDLFPGLGWLLMRNEYTETLRQSWPTDNWDWYVRGVYQRKDRECIHPEIPRTFHIGRKGTFVKEEDQRSIFDLMDHSMRSDLDWTSPEAKANLINALHDRYDGRIERILKAPSTMHVNDPTEFVSVVTNGKCPPYSVLWYEANPEPSLERKVLAFAKYFGIWHQLIRGSHEGVHEILHKNCRVLLINIFEGRAVHSTWFTSYTHRSRFAALRPESSRVFAPDEFVDLIGQTFDDSLLKRIVVAQDAGISCYKACRKNGRTCVDGVENKINDCSLLKRYFPCTSCQQSIGPDQPCYVLPTAPADKFPNQCLVTQESTYSCAGKHPLTRRLCLCD